MAICSESMITKRLNGVTAFVEITAFIGMDRKKTTRRNGNKT